MSYFLLAAVVAATATTCCDSRHAYYAAGADNAALCQARGGIAITEPVWDDGSHTFNILRQCALPCGQQLTVEKP